MSTNRKREHNGKESKYDATLDHKRTFLWSRRMLYLTVFLIPDTTDIVSGHYLSTDFFNGRKPDCFAALGIDASKKSPRIS